MSNEPHNQIFRTPVKIPLKGDDSYGEECNAEESSQQRSEEENKSENELLDIGIDLGDGKEEHILVYEGDNAQDVADTFCLKHKLDPRQKAILVDQIKKAMEDELRNRTPNPTQNIYNETISENVDEDDSSEHHVSIGAKIPVLGARLSNRTGGTGYTANSRKSDPIKPPTKKPEQENWESIVGTKLRQKVSKPVSTAKNTTAQASTKYPSTIHTARQPTAAPSPPIQCVELSPSQSSDLISLENRFKRGNSVGDIGRGVSLYERGIKKKAMHARIAKEKINERRIKEMEGVTFKPSINSSAKSIKSYIKKKPEERLMCHLKVVQEKQEKIKHDVSKEWEAKHPFHPTINKRSMLMAKERALSDKKMESKRFAQLFEDSKRRKVLEEKRREIIPDAECTFSPNIEVTHEFDSSELSRRRNLQHSAERLAKKRTLKNSESDFDLITGQPLYHPLIGRPPQNRPKSKAENIGDYLYALKTGRKKSDTQEESSILESSKNMSLVHDRSNQLVDKLRKDCFAAIFNVLDSDGDGIISADAIETGELPEKVVGIYLPVFKEMEEMKCTLNLEEFVETSNNLFRELTVLQRNELIEFYKSLGSTRGSRSLSCEEYPFKPCISQRSREIANKKAVPGVDLATKLLQMQQLSKIKLDKLRKESENAKLKDCSFKPQISPVKEGLYDFLDDSKFTSPIREIYGRLLGNDINKSFEEPDDS